MTVAKSGDSADRPLLSVIILTKNEERHLPRALTSLAGLSVELFVIDSFSTDGTQQAARAAGAMFVQHQFESHSAQFNWALENLPLHGDWVMKLDADEYIEADLRRFLMEELSTIPSGIHGIYIRCKQIFLGKWVRHGGVYPLTLLRIWRRGSAHLQPKLMDEHVVMKNGLALRSSAHIANAPLISVTEFCEKHLTYAEREAADFLNRRSKVHTAGGLRLPRTQAEFKSILKYNVYERLPFLFGPLLYWAYRIVLRSGWRDGTTGFAYHFLQGFWYRSMVQIKIWELETRIHDSSSPT